MIKFEETAQTKEVYCELKRIRLKMQRGIRRGLYDSGNEIVREVRRLIKSPPKTGRIYIIAGRKHQASAPYQSPANLSGRLMNSSDFKVRGHQELEIGESAPYAKVLEEGGKKMAARPHIKKAMLLKQIDTLNSICENINKKLESRYMVERIK